MSGIAKKIQDGAVFVRLTVLGRAENYVTPAGKTHAAYSCRCECGAERVVLGASLRAGRTQSCGCLGAELSGMRSTKHGANRKGMRAPEYNSWAQMRSRCNDPGANNFEHYGGRGIKVCDRWASFENFLADMGPRPPGCSIDRFPDVNGNYEPSNCRWATRREQSLNTTRNLLITYSNRTMTLREWADETGIAYSCIRARLRRGWPVERAMQP